MIWQGVRVRCLQQPCNIEITEGWEGKPGYIKLSPGHRCSMMAVCRSVLQSSPSQPAHVVWLAVDLSPPTAPSDSPPSPAQQAVRSHTLMVSQLQRNFTWTTSGSATSYFSLASSQQCQLKCRDRTDRMSQWDNSNRKQWITGLFIQRKGLSRRVGDRRSLFIWTSEEVSDVTTRVMLCKHILMLIRNWQWNCVMMLI